MRAAAPPLLLLLSAVTALYIFVFHEAGAATEWIEGHSGTVYASRLQQCHTMTEDVAFVVMASSTFSERHLAQRATWMRGIKNVHSFSDEAAPYVQTLPQLEHRPSYYDAQYRQLYGMQYMLAHNVSRAAKWFMLVDDDTWVNIPALRRYLTQLAPLQSGRVITGFRHPPSGMFNGGAGIVLSASAFWLIADALFSRACPFSDTNDNTISLCAMTLGNLTMLHSNLFSFFPPPMSSVADFVEKVSIHPVKSRAQMQFMTEAAKRHMHC